MSFSTRLALAITALLALALSVGGYILVRQNFEDSLDAAIGYNLNQHLLERYALESELLGISASNIALDGSRIERYGQSITDYMGDGEKLIAFYDNRDREIFSNLPAAVTEAMRLDMLGQATGSYRLVPLGEQVYMLTVSPVGRESQVRLLSAYDMTRVFAQRSRQLANVWRMEAILLVVAIALAWVLSRILTRPIRRLNVASGQIAEGAYDVRTGIRSGDEFGELSQNFDRMADTIEERISELNQNVHQRDDFISAFTHEIKTPMTSIIGYSDIMRSMECDAQTRQKAANHIYHEAKRLEALSQKLLILMGLSEERLHFRPVRLGYLFTMAARSLGSAAEEITLDFEEPGDVTLRGDLDLLCDLLRNLILNAMKAEPKDNTVRVGWQRELDDIRIFVADKGRGIPEEELNRIIEPFYMIDKSRARAVGGSGIGLALCSRIAEIHGSKLEFVSAVGKGTTVSLAVRHWERGAE